MEKRNSQHERASKRRLGCGSLSITTPASLLVNELDVRSAFRGLVSLAVAVNHMCVIHEAMNGCENLKIH